MFLGLHQSKATGFDLDQKLGVFDTPAQKMVVQDQFLPFGHSLFIFCFTDFLDLFLMSEDEKKIKIKFRI